MIALQYDTVVGCGSWLEMLRLGDSGAGRSGRGDVFYSYDNVLAEGEGASRVF